MSSTDGMYVLETALVLSVQSAIKSEFDHLVDAVSTNNVESGASQFRDALKNIIDAYIAAIKVAADTLQQYPQWSK